MEYTTLNNRRVVITEGVIDEATGKHIYGVFTDESHAYSPDADSLAIAIVGADKLTPLQIEQARRNSDF